MTPNHRLPPLLACLIVAIWSSAGLAQVVGVPWVYEIARPTNAEVSLLVLPDGSGSTLASAQVFGGQTVDATVTVRVTDELGLPIPNFPAEDLWLTGETPTVASCRPWGFMADRNTDVNGETVFAVPLAGGGWTEDPMWVYLNGSRAVHPVAGELPPVALHINSPDLNADGIVNMTDLVTFAGDYHGAYRYRSDFAWDGVVNLSDVTIMAVGLGRGCQ